MADKKITALSEIAAGDVHAIDLLHIVDSPTGTPVNKKMSLSRLFNNIPTYLALDDVESLDETATSVSATKAVSLIDLTGTSGNVTMTLANASSVGQLKIIVRKDDNDSDDLIINVTSWTDGSSSNDIVLETGGAVVCIALGAEGSLVWYPISVLGTGSSVSGV